MSKRTREHNLHVEETAAALPPLSPVVIDAVTDMLMTDQGMRRPPEKAAALLALCVELHQQGLPFPTRHTVAGALDCSVFTIDAALSTRIAEGYLSQVVEVKKGSVSNRPSIIRERYYVPSSQVLSVVAKAKVKKRR